MRIIITALLLTFLLQVSSASEKKSTLSQEEKWHKLLNLIENEINTIQKNKYSSAELEHRLFELFCEKIKIQREKENQNLINTGEESKERPGKESFFKNSKNQALEAQTYAFKIIKNQKFYF